jgi:murein L,D-transpeptidase YcbB/YkuD
VGDSSRRFLATRSGGRRYHVGIDLYGNVGDPVVAVADGTIANFYEFYAGSYALIVNHGAVTVNYSEVRADSLGANGLRVGDRVRAGQVMGAVAMLVESHMCHFETYLPGTTANKRWLVADPRPQALLNPTALLLHLAEQGIGIDAKKAAQANAKLARPDQLNWQTKLTEIGRALGMTTLPANAGDEALALAAARFQASRGMGEDGVIGRGTLTALGV